MEKVKNLGKQIWQRNMAAKLASEVMFVETKSSGVQPLQRMCHSIFKRQWEQIVVLRTAAKKISKDLGN